MQLHIPGPVKRHPVVSVLSVLLVTPFVIVFLWTFISLHYTYSSGDRAGYLQKISKRGWICKTWEGEVLSTAMPGAAPEKFFFTTRSDSIAEILNKMNGQHVSLHYEQHVHVPTSCFGDTEYFITGARLVTEK